MCNRYSFFGSLEVLNNSLGIDDVDKEPAANYNMAPNQCVPAILKEKGRIHLRHLHWGLIPSWAEEPDIGAFMINAREDSLPIMACFKYAFKRRRCLIPANGYFEWAGDNGGKQPYYITSENGELFCFAGLFENWLDACSGTVIESCTIITTDASPGIAHLQDRMPVILTKEAYQAWLDPGLQDIGRLTHVLAAGKVGHLKFYSVSRDVNSSYNNNPELVQPYNIQ